LPEPLSRAPSHRWPWQAEPPPPPAGDASWPRITVVTPSYNQAAFLEETIRSVLLQGYPNLEYFIVDGASADSSVDIIRHYQPHLDWWTSEKDRGQSHAINKGFARSTGDIVAWLNSDDCYLPGALFAAASARARNPDAGLYIGACDVLDMDGSVKPLFPHFAERALDHALDWGANWRRFPQPATFISRRALEAVGPVNERLHYVMDMEYWLRVFRAGFPAASVEHKLALHRFHKTSKTVDASDAMAEERLRVSRACCGWPWERGSWKRWTACRRRESDFHVEAALGAFRRGERLRGARHFARSFVSPWRAAVSWFRVELPHALSPRRRRPSA